MLVSNVCMSVRLFVCLLTLSWPQFFTETDHNAPKYQGPETLAQVRLWEVKVKGQGHGKALYHIIGHSFGSNCRRDFKLSS